MKKKLTALLTTLILMATPIQVSAQETQVGYTVTGNYEITIPAYIDLNSENQLKIEASFLSLMDGYHVNVSIAEESLSNKTLILNSSEGNTISTEMMILTNGSGSELTNDRMVARYNKDGCEFGGQIQIMPIAGQYTPAGQYYGTLMFETEMVQD